MYGKNGCANKTIPKMYVGRHRQAVGALNDAKRPNFRQNEGRKYKIVNVEANFTLGTL